MDVPVLASVSLLLCLGLWNSACAKRAVAQAPAAVKPEPAKAAPAAPVAPTIALSAAPNVLTKGQQTTLSWHATNATTVTLDNGIGTVSSTGQRSITPTMSTTYTANVNGPGGAAEASTRVTVEAPVTPPSPPALSDTEFFEKHIRDIFFDFNMYDIRSDQQQAEQADVSALSERPNLKVMIEGHCDERGSEKYNLALGDRRANAEKSYLVARGISESQIDTISYGKDRPFDTEHNEEAWAQNRRDHFVLK